MRWVLRGCDLDSEVERILHHVGSPGFPFSNLWLPSSCLEMSSLIVAVPYLIGGLDWG